MRVGCAAYDHQCNQVCDRGLTREFDALEAAAFARVRPASLDHIPSPGPRLVRHQLRSAKEVAVGQGIAEVLTFAVGVAVSPVPIIAVILMLFSARAKINGPMFLLGWVAALAIVSFAAYFAADAGDPSTSSAASDTISWGTLVLGALMLALAMRSWRNRPARGEQPDMPKWMDGIEDLAPGKALGLGLLLAGVNPKNLILTVGASTGLAQLGLETADAVVSLIVFVAIGSLTIAVPVAYYLLGGSGARAALDGLKAWLTTHNDAVMAVLFLVFGVKLIAEAIPPLTG
jgi:hypothetical protein